MSNNKLIPGSPNSKWLHDIIKQIERGNRVYICTTARLRQLRASITIPITSTELAHEPSETVQFMVEKERYEWRK